MACCANRICIAMVEREEGVVRGRKRRGQPCCGGVACGAGRGPSSRGVIGVCGPGKRCLVAGVAISGCTRKHIVDVARSAGDGSVGAGERERCVVVIEDRSRPRLCGMACGAGCGEARRYVIGIRRAGVVGLVAGVAIGWNRCVVVIGVA